MLFLESVYIETCFVFVYYFSCVACFCQFVIFSGLKLAKAVAILGLWLCGGLHQVITFSFSRNRGYFCFMLLTRWAWIWMVQF